MHRKNILFIAQPYAPHSGSHATRVNGLVEAFIKQGHHVDVITTSLHKGQLGLDWEPLSYLQEAKVFRAFCGPLHYATYMRNRWRRTPRGTSFGSQAKKQVLIPDTYVEWVPFAVALLARLRAWRTVEPDLIISSATPYSCHLIGLVAKKLFGVTWVADFGDPWLLEISVTRGPLRHRVERTLEAAVINRADVITWATEESRNAYASLYQRRAASMHVLRMGYRADDFARCRSRSSTTNGPLILTYTGRIPPEHRNVDRLLEVFSKLKEAVPLTLKLAGSELESLAKRVSEAGLSNVEFLGSLTHCQFVDLMVCSDFLVLLGNRSPLQVPGKLFQYFGARKPILYIKNMPAAERDETEWLLATSGVPHTVIDMDGEMDVASVADFLRSFTSGKKNESNIAMHTWDERANELMSLISGNGGLSNDPTTRAQQSHIDKDPETSPNMSLSL